MVVVYTLTVIVFAIMIAYSLRHYRFLKNRLFQDTDRAHQDLAGHHIPSVTVIVPMHNEEAEVEGIIWCLENADYPVMSLEVIAVNDNSDDDTGAILDRLAQRRPWLSVVHRENSAMRGKAHALIEGTARSAGEVILVFDADYRPGRDVIKRLVAPFCDPSVAAVMGRVVPSNSAATPLTRLLDIERSGGYQTNQQARQNLDLVVQYGGTVGGVRRTALDAVGGWREHLTEDTDLTFRLYLGGFKVCYVNLAECYEQAVQNWTDRAGQLRRWAMGHNRCLFDYLGPLLRSPLLSMQQKADGVLLLGAYVLPIILLVGWMMSIWIYMFGDMSYWGLFTAAIGTTTYNTWGNLAVFGEIGSALILDRRRASILLLPFGIFSFFASVWICSWAFIRSLRSRMEGRSPEWKKTPRYARVGVKR